MKRTEPPTFLKPLLWTYDFSIIDLEKHKKTIIVNVINYGDLDGWRWLVTQYRKEGVQEILKLIPASELRPQARKLAGLLFSVTSFNDAPRGVKK